MKYSVAAAAIASLAVTASADKDGFAMWSKRPVAAGAKPAKEGNRIVNGYPAEPGRYPYMVGLMDTATSVFPRCGGTLIAPNIVLSAGHCEAAATFVSVGCYDLENAASESTCERIAVAQRIVHPDYFEDVNRVPFNDNMLLVLAENSTNTPIKYIADKAYENTIPDGLQTRVMGWGTIFSNGPQSSILLQTEVDMVNFEECANLYEPELDDFTMPESMFCAARPGRDSCQGDSGGPFIISCDITGEDIIIGDVSWGFGCADPDFPGVYASVGNAFESFIKPTVESFGHTLEVSTENPAEYCTIGGTHAPSAPTPPPTFAENCAGYIGANDGCDCGCTDGSGNPVFDPDCEGSAAPDFEYCPGSQVCDVTTGECYDGTSAPTSPTIPATPTPTCNGFIGTNDGCDCGCFDGFGNPEFDPDCEGASAPDYDYCDPSETCDVSTGECLDGSVPTSSPHGPIITFFPTVSPTAEVTTTSAPGNGDGVTFPVSDNLIFLIALGLVAGIVGAVLAFGLLKMCTKSNKAEEEVEVKAGALVSSTNPAYL